MTWSGHYGFIIRQLILKDFRVRYRNMSLGIFWSLLNPLVTMVVLTFVFTKVFSSTIPHFPAFLLCGLVPFNFFALAWSIGTGAIVDNGALMKRVPVPREIVLFTSILSNVLHLGIQIALLLAIVLLSGAGVNIHWLWLPLLWGLEIVFVLGLSMITSAVNVFVRDTRYVVEAASAVLFWLVPIFYGLELVPAGYVGLYQYNPMAAIVLALRNVLLDGHAPAVALMLKLVAVTVVVFGIGWSVFQRLKPGFYDHL